MEDRATKTTPNNKAFTNNINMMMLLSCGKILVIYMMLMRDDSSDAIVVDTLVYRSCCGH